MLGFTCYRISIEPEAYYITMSKESSVHTREGSRKKAERDVSEIQQRSSFQF